MPLWGRVMRTNATGRGNGVRRSRILEDPNQLLARNTAAKAAVLTLRAQERYARRRRSADRLNLLHSPQPAALGLGQRAGVSPAGSELRRGCSMRGPNTGGFGGVVRQTID